MYFIFKNKNKNIFYYLYFLIIFSLLKISNNYIVLPFKLTNISLSEINDTFDNPIEEILTKININKIYTSISFGDPSNNIDFYFSMTNFISSIDNNICLKDSKSSYNPLNSKTLKNILNQNKKNENIEKHILSQEKCSIYKDLDLSENITFNKFEFYLKKNKNSFNDNNINIYEPNKYCGNIGLSRYSSNSIYDKDSFIYNLKENNIINSYSFGIFFFDQNKLYNIDDDTQERYEGFFIAGVTVNDNIDIFDTEFICSVYAEEDSTYWTFFFDRIFYYEKINDKVEYINTNNTRVEIIVDLNYIISDEQYYMDIKKYYFQKFFDNKTCYEEKLYIKEEGYTYMIICNISFKNNQRSFPGVYFYSEQLSLAFNLYANDIFYEYNNKIYFLIVYKDSIKNYWRLGSIFLRKYPFMFDYDKKIISYVHMRKTWKPKNHTKKKKVKIQENQSNSKNIKEYILYILLVIGIFIGLFIGKRIWNKNKRLKANELEESYQYMDKENNKLGILK